MDNRTYAQKLTDPQWQKMRLKVFERDLFQCQICGDTKSNLQVHHKKYYPGLDPWQYLPADLVTICKDCHEKETHSRPAYERYLLDAFNYAGFSAFELMALSVFISKYPGFNSDLRKIIDNHIENSL